MCNDMQHVRFEPASRCTIGTTKTLAIEIIRSHGTRLGELPRCENVTSRSILVLESFFRNSI